MKKNYALMCLVAFTATASGQTLSDFENLSLPMDSFWNGKYNTAAKGFSSGNAFFTNFYDTSFGGFWAEGFAYSTKRDTMTAGFGNLYSSITGSGYAGSGTYCVGQQGAIIRLTGAAKGKWVAGMRVTNTTYAYKSMKNGDAFSKKFGGVTGHDPDYFRMTITGWYNGSQVSNKVDFYLADFTSPNDSQDYIVNNWADVQLGMLGNVDSLKITLSSSDTGSFGINTPLFYAIDNFFTLDFGAGVNGLPQLNSGAEAWPNPFSEQLQVQNNSTQPVQVEVYTLSGTQMLTLDVNAGERKHLQTVDWPAGMYFIHSVYEGNRTTRKLVKY